MLTGTAHVGRAQARVTGRSNQATVSRNAEPDRDGQPSATANDLTHTKVKVHSHEQRPEYALVRY